MGLWYKFLDRLQRKKTLKFLPTSPIPPVYSPFLPVTVGQPAALQWLPFTRVLCPTACSKIALQGFPGGSVVKNLLPMQGTWVRALAREDPTCRGATKPMRHNY